MLQQEKPDDYVIATGETNTLEDFTGEVFRTLGLSWREHVINDLSLLRPTDILVSRGNPTRAATVLGWKAKYRMCDVARMMVDAALKS